MVKTPPAQASRVAEDYLTLIWKASEWPGDGRRPTTTELAASLGVTMSTVSASLKRLAREGLIRYEPYGPIELTGEGERIALAVVRRHRIIETFLVEHLGMPWDEVHAEADRLEHAVSDALIERMDALLGRPDADPHGDPIPGRGAAPAVPAVLLSACSAGSLVRIVRVSDEQPAILQFLSDRQIAIGTLLRVEAPLAATGLMRVSLGADLGAPPRPAGAAEPFDLSEPIARAIHVTVPDR